MDEYYKILELPVGADKSAIKAAFRRMAKLYHPDVDKSAGAKHRFQKILEAYNVLYYGKSIKKATTYRPYSPAPPHSETFAERKARFAKARKKKQTEKLKKEREEFEKSYFYDFTRLISFVFRIFVLFLAFLMLFTSIKALIFKFYFELNYFFPFLTLVSIAIFIYVYINRKTYFIIGKLNITFQEFILLFFGKPNLQQECFFSDKSPANGYSYKLRFYKIKDVKTYVGTPLNHQVSTKTEVKIVYISRTQFAFKVHLFVKLIRWLSVILFLIFLPIESGVWSFFWGIVASVIASKIIYFYTKTVSDFYFFNNILLYLRLGLVLFTMILATDFTNFQFQHSERLGTWLILLFIFSDFFITPLVVEIPNNQMLRSFGKKKYPKISQLLDQKFLIGYAESFASAMYSVYKWFF